MHNFRKGFLSVRQKRARCGRSTTLGPFRTGRRRSCWAGAARADPGAPPGPGIAAAPDTVDICNDNDKNKFEIKIEHLRTK